jgi:hypothetical protein
MHKRTWSRSSRLAGEIVERGRERGEIGPDVDPGLVLELVIAPIYFRVLMSGERLGSKFVRELARLAAQAAGARPKA